MTTSPNPTTPRNVQPQRTWLNSGWPTVRRKDILYAALAIAIVTIIFKIAFYYLTTGTISVTSDDPQAKITVINSAKDSKTVNSGGSLRLKVGSYNVIGNSGKQQSVKTAEVHSRQNTAVSLAFEKTVPITQVAGYNASSLYIQGNQLYFVDNASKTPYTFTSGDSTGRPFYTNLYPLERVSWLSPTNFYALRSDDWKVVTNGSISNLALASSITDDTVNPTRSTSVSFNSSGAISFLVGTNQVLLQDSDGQQHVIKADSPNTQTSIAPDGSLLYYGIDSASKTKLYSNGATSDVPISAPTNVTWSPDSKKIAYSAADGIYTYDTVTKQSAHALVAAIEGSASPTWFDNTTLLFINGQAIWKYNVNDRSSVKLAAVDGDATTYDPIIVGPDKQNVYFSIVRQNGGGIIYRVAPNYNRLSDSQRQAVEQAAIKSGSTNNATAVYSGFQNLGDQASLSSDQLSNTRFAISRFVRNSNIAARSVSIPIESIHGFTHDTATGNNSILFIVKVDKTSYSARLAYDGLLTIRLYLTDAQGNQVFDSGPIRPQ